jgi:hypothetical protein
MVSILSVSGLFIGAPSMFRPKKQNPLGSASGLIWQIASKILSASPQLAGTGTNAATTTAAGSVLADGEHQPQCSKAAFNSQSLLLLP